MSQLPPPMRVLPVDRVVFPDDLRRPASITPIGAMSIVVAALTGIACLISIVFGLATYVAAAQQKVFTTIANSQAYPVAADPTDTLPNPDAFTTQQAQKVVAGLRLAHPLTSTQAQHVQKLLEQHGKKMFLFDPSSLTTNRIRDNVSESGEFLGSQGKMSVFYSIGTGRIEVSDTQALFRSDQNDVFRSTDIANDQSLSEAQISVVAHQINQHLQSGMNADQFDAVRDLLRNPAQAIIDPSLEVKIQSAGDFPDQSGGVWFYTNKAIQVQVTKEGKASVLNAFAPIPGTNPFSGKKITTGWATGLIGGAVVNGLIAILLLIAAIQFLRGRPSGRKLHLFYGWLQVIMIFVVSLLLGMTISEWTAAKSSASTPNDTIPWIITSLTAITGIIWPILILIIMTRKSVRDYFTGVM